MIPMELPLQILGMYNDECIYNHQAWLGRVNYCNCCTIITNLVANPPLSSSSSSSRIFAQYGFANTDGAGRRAALLAPFHRVLAGSGQDGNIDYWRRQQQQEQDLKRYLEGYEINQALVPEQTGDVLETSTMLEEFRDVKLKLLRRFANHQSKWVVSVPGASNLQQENEDIITSIQALLDTDDGWREVLSTSRLLALQPEDYDGNGLHALQLILQGIEDGSLEISAFQMKRGSPAMEQRAWSWFGHLLQETLELLLNSTEEETSKRIKRSEKIASNDHYDTSLDYVRSGEIDAIRILIKYHAMLQVAAD
jgi:hypothetical protein